MKWVAFALKLALAFSILAFLIHKVGRKNVWGALTRIDWRLLVAAVPGYCVQQLISTKRLQILLRAGGAGIAYLRLLAIYFIGMFFNTILPTLVGGDAVRIAYIYKETGRLDRAVAASLTDRVVGVSALILIALATLPFAGGLASPRLVGALAVIAAAFAVGTATLYFPWMYRVATRCARLAGLSTAARIIEKLENAITPYRRQTRVLAVALLLSFGVQFVVMAVYTLLAYGIGICLPVRFFLMAVPVTVLASMIPVLPSGLGIRELTWVWLLKERGVPESDAIALSLLWFLVAAVASLLGGPVFVLWRKQNGQRVVSKAPGAEHPQPPG